MGSRQERNLRAFFSSSGGTSGLDIDTIGEDNLFYSTASKKNKHALYSFHLSPPSLSHLPAAQLNPMSHTQHCVTSMGAPSWNCSGLEGDEAEDGDAEPSEEGGEGPAEGQRTGQGEGGLSFLLKQEDTETQNAYIFLYNRLNVAVREMRQYVAQIDV